MSHPLFDKLAQYEDIESAITIYLEAAADIATLKDIQTIARNRIASYLAETGETVYKCGAGTAKYTKPRTPRLDKKAWDSARLRDSSLASVQHAFDLAESVLDQAQEPFKALPDPQLRISR